MLDNEGKPMLHDLYHRYRVFLVYPCTDDGSDLSASPHLIYLFEKYFGYDPNKSSNLSVILTSTIALIIAATTIIWGFM